jgi:hypothetical protein
MAHDFPVSFQLSCCGASHYTYKTFEIY